MTSNYEKDHKDEHEELCYSLDDLETAAWSGRMEGRCEAETDEKVAFWRGVLAGVSPGIIGVIIMYGLMKH